MSCLSTTVGIFRLILDSDGDYADSPQTSPLTAGIEGIHRATTTEGCHHVHRE